MDGQWKARNIRGNSFVNAPVSCSPCLPEFPWFTPSTYEYVPHRVPTHLLLDVSRFQSDYPAVFLFLYASSPF